jgi:ubiquinone/menaquinone biosynthesis C-methylase UbiE
MSAGGTSGQAYDELYEETACREIGSYYLWLMEQMQLPIDGSLLDVSCGAGEVVRLAVQHGLTAVGVDISEVVARKANHELGPFGMIAVSPGEHLPFSDNVLILSPISAAWSTSMIRH